MQAINSPKLQEKLVNYLQRQLGNRTVFQQALRDSAGQQLLRRSRSIKVTNFCNNRKLVYATSYYWIILTYVLSSTVCQIQRSIDQIIASNRGASL